MASKTLLYVVFVFSVPLYCGHEYTLSDLMALTKKYTGNIAPDNKDYYNPSFTSYFASQRPNIFSMILQFFGIAKDPFPIQDFVHILRSVIEVQKSRGRIGDYIMGTQLASKQKIIIFGNIQGAFHSLVRDLQELKRQGIIDEQLKIIDSNYYIIFNGSVVARSAEPLQTLLVALLLMNKNPDNIIYLESDFERGEEWSNKGFAQQVNSVYPKYRDEIFSQFKEFIEVMPFAFYGSFAENPDSLLKFTALKELEHESVENSTGNLFAELKKNEIHTWQLNNKTKTSKPVHVSVFINGLGPTVKVPRLKALMFLEPYEMASAWRVFSSPTFAFQKAYNFNQDAFACIECKQQLSNSIIDLFSRDADSQEPFKRTQFNLETGIETQEKVIEVKPKMYIASTLDLSKTNYVIGDRLRTGIFSAVNQTNSLGLVPGNVVKSVIFEDFYIPHIAYDNFQMLENEFNIRTFLLSIGTTALQVAGDDIKAGNILSAFPVIGAPEYRKADLKGVINFTPSYDLEFEALLNFLVKKYRLKTFGFFYQDDDYGIGALQKAKEILKKLGIERCIEIPYSPYTTNFDKQREIIKNEQPEALGFVSNSFAAQEFLRQVGAVNLVSTQLFALAFVGDDVFTSFVKNEMGLSCIFTRVTPDPYKSMLPIVQEYRSLMDDQGKRYGMFSLLAYICTSILCDMMKRVTGAITHTALIEKFEALKDYNFKGLTLTFDPQDRQISKRVWLDLQDGSEWQEVL